jgi:hypothetical protein
MMVYVNILFAILFWKFAIDSFEEGKEALGWFNIFVSAFNTAGAAAVIIN